MSKRKFTTCGTKEFFPQPEKKMVVGKYFVEDYHFCDDKLMFFPEWMQGIIINIWEAADGFEDYFVSARAKCDDRDEYDEMTGVDIVSEKLDMKFHNKTARKCWRMARLARQVADALDELGIRHFEKYKFIRNDLEEFYGGEG